MCSWRLSRNEPESKNFAKEEPDPSAQTLKLFAEDFVVTRKDIPSQYSVRHKISCFVAEWERKTGRTLPKNLKNDIYNVSHPLILLQIGRLINNKYIENVLTPKYNLTVQHREKFPVTNKDLSYLLRHLFEEDDHDYPHELMRIYCAFTLSLFSASGARAGAVVEASSYSGSNESLHYKVCPTILQQFRR